MRDLAKLIEYINLHGYHVLGGELQRFAAEQQKRYDAGKSRAKPGESFHQKCQAIDIEIFTPDGDWVKTPERKNFPTDGDYRAAVNEHRNILKKFGDYWISLDPESNRWGGYFKSLYDPNHYEKK